MAACTSAAGAVASWTAPPAAADEADAGVIAWSATSAAQSSGALLRAGDAAEWGRWRARRLSSAIGRHEKRWQAFARSCADDSWDLWYCCVCLACCKMCNWGMWAAHVASAKHKAACAREPLRLLPQFAPRPAPTLEPSALLATTGCEEAWRDAKRLMVLGELDFSFSLALLDRRGRDLGAGVAATSFAPEAALNFEEGRAASNVAALRAAGAEVSYGVDACALERTAPAPLLVDTFIFPFPCSRARYAGGHPEECVLIGEYFASCRRLYEAGGACRSVQLVLQAARLAECDVLATAAEAGWRLRSRTPLELPGYVTRKTTSEAFVPCSAFVFTFCR
eukprot:TRINITY_DN24686_c0_g1_i2.p1 TRINITY_DN24686_c0_g1~~TRINITY_DN24686_c0_g1_i2.p1  ORF type:complete len:337 (+),score=75.30 TRINITY_DN24686_c0_g1_i2:55-1065(+)